MAQKVKILHFNGLESLWNERLSSGVYNNSIVFAKVWSDTYDYTIGSRELKHRIVYAGKDVNGTEYSYEVADTEKLIEIENFLSIDASGNFVNNLFRISVAKLIDDLFNENSSSGYVTSALSKVKSAIEWQNVEE